MTKTLRDLNAIHLGIVCPMANEADNAAAFLEEVVRHAAGVARLSVFVVIDNVSEDGTREVVGKFGARDGRVRAVWAPENRCVVDAYVRGYREAVAAGCDWILEMDAGFSHLPEQIPRFLDRIREPLDCVFATRFGRGGKLEGGSFKRRTISRGGTWLANLFLGTRLSDMTSGFELFSRAAMERILERGIRSRAHFFQTEIRAFCHGMRIVEVPITYRMPSPRLRGGALVEALRELRRLHTLKRKGQLLAAPIVE